MQAMFKDLFVPATGAPGEEDAITSALALAAHDQGHVAVMVAVETPRALVWETYPANYYRQLHDEARSQAERQADALRQRLAREEVPSDVRVVDAVLMQPTRVAAVQAAHADLAVMPLAGTAGDRRRSLEHLFVDLLMQSGRPVLVVPPARPLTALPVQRAVIAWRPGAPATRALHDALPLLRKAASIEVLLVDPDVGELADGEQPGADIATHLARHGLEVQVTAMPAAGRSAGEVIIQRASESGAQLIVAGGYSHSRYREQILGGVTRDLLQGTSVPVLFSH
jgi:nucleotide-binding universal stress UspA family protein